MPDNKTAAGFEPDVVIVGSGAGGGMAAYVLTKAGIKTLILEAGRDYDPVSGKRHAEMEPRGAAARQLHPRQAFRLLRRHREWRLDGAGRALHHARRVRPSAGGGRACWAGAPIIGAAIRRASGPTTSSRRAATGWAWTGRFPMTKSRPSTTAPKSWSASSAPMSGWRTIPNSSPGVLQPAPKPRITELMIQAAADDLGIPCVPSRYAVLTRDIDHPACAAPGLFQCLAMRARLRHRRGVPDHHLAAAHGDGHRQAAHHHQRHGDAASSPTHAARRRAWNISTRTAHRISSRARVVVLAASACETAKILLNSAAEASQGLANSSGEVGRNLMDTTGTNVTRPYPGAGRPPALQ